MHLFLVTFSSYKNTVICIKTINLPYLSKLIINMVERILTKKEKH